MKTINLSQIMKLAWQFFKQTGESFSECLKKAWANFRLVQKMQSTIVRFYFKKVDGSVREAWGTLSSKVIPTTTGEDKRAKNETIQTYYDTEANGWRCFKKLNLI